MSYGDPERQSTDAWLRNGVTGEPIERSDAEWRTRRTRIGWQIEDTRDEAARAARVARYGPPTALALAVATAAVFVTVATIPNPRGDDPWGVPLILVGVVLGFAALAGAVYSGLTLADHRNHGRHLRRWTRALDEHDDADAARLLGDDARTAYDAAVATAAAGGDPTRDPDHDPAPDLAELGLDDTEEIR